MLALVLAPSVCSDELQKALQLFEHRRQWQGPRRNATTPHGPAPRRNVPPQATVVRVCSSLCRAPFWMAVPSAETNGATIYAAGNVQTDLRSLGFFSPDETSLVATILSGCRRGRADGNLMVDLGANTGYFSMMALNAGCRVVAFEPTAMHEGYLRLSAALSGRASSFTLHQKLVGDVSGQHIPFDSWNVALSKRRGTTTTAETLRPDDAVREDVLYLKMDIEGHEPHGFRGLTKLLQTKVVSVVLWEHTPSFYAPADLASPPSATLKALGYWICNRMVGGNNYVALHPKADPAIAAQVRAHCRRPPVGAAGGSAKPGAKPGATSGAKHRLEAAPAGVKKGSKPTEGGRRGRRWECKGAIRGRRREPHAAAP